MDKRLNIAAALIVIQCVVLMAWPAPEMFFGHAFLPEWPSHARFHLIWASGTLLSLCLIVILLAWYGLRKGDKVSWFAILIFTLGSQAFSVPARMLNEGPPMWSIILGALVPVIALIISAGPVFKTSQP